MTAGQLRAAHLVLAIIWTLLLVPTVIWWKDSILWIGLISVYAIVIAHLAAYAGARSEEES